MSSVSSVGRKPPPPPKPKNLSQEFARALFDYTADDPEELSFKEGDILYVVDKVADQEWWKARLKGRDGFVPSNFLCTLGDDDYSPSLHDACRRGNIELLEECLDNRLPVNSSDKADNTAVHYACHSGHLDCLRMLLDRVDIRLLKLNDGNRLGETPLHLAAARGHAGAVKILRQHEHDNPGAVRIDIDAKNANGETALDKAVQPEVRAELIKWKESRNIDVGLVRQISQEYANSDEEE